MNAPAADLQAARAQFYATRLDAELAAKPDDAARAALLAKELKRWRDLYRRFVDRINRGIEPENDATAFDYLLTITEIEKRQGRYARRPA